MARSSDRVTTKELGDKLDTLASAMLQLVEMQKAAIIQQQETGEAISTLAEHVADRAEREQKARDALEERMESPEMVRVRLAREGMTRIVHAEDDPIVININGAVWVINPGENIVPVAVASAYQQRGADIRSATDRQKKLRGLKSVNELNAILANERMEMPARLGEHEYNPFSPAPRN